MRRTTLIMGIDNNAILVVGLPENQIPNPKPLWDDVDFTYEAPNLPRDMYPARYEQDYWRQAIAGIEVADSGCYSYKEIPDLEARLALAHTSFQAIFGLQGKAHILNRQW